MAVFVNCKNKCDSGCENLYCILIKNIVDFATTQCYYFFLSFQYIHYGCFFVCSHCVFVTFT